MKSYGLTSQVSLFVTTSYRVQIILMDGRGENPDEQRDSTQNNSTISPPSVPYDKSRTENRLWVSALF